MTLKELKEQIEKIELENENADEMELFLYFNSQQVYSNVWLETNDEKEVEIHWMC
jgi:hypothetical protein